MAYRAYAPMGWQGYYWGNYLIDYDSILYATYFHGFISSDETIIREWLCTQNVDKCQIDKIIKISQESQRLEIPETIEGKILHDAHVLEGGKTYILVKSLITGSVRGQTLVETIDFIEKNILYKNQCYLPETIPLLNEANKFAKNFIAQLKKDII